MFSQSTFAQLVRMLLLLIAVLFAVHNSPTLFELIASQGMSCGCHQHTETVDADEHSHHHHHH
ncbi:hypothetical protein [Vibrio sp. SCSIO 43136]|uniref:hypothetical protein n=1 Tax=Vibrio sp. SCSIO 43136 TaxID=2819101 RepID=UPI002075C9FC|nr:hypothetical protein [Vibrio sp. SCSIO 43136]